MDGGRRCFNSRPREGGDTPHPEPCRCNRCFNSRPREGGDLPDLTAQLFDVLFQLTPPRRGRRSTRLVIVRWRRFNSRPREGGDGCGSAGVGGDHVSTHAPAKGATRISWISPAPNGVSTHAPAKGATLVWANNYCIYQFQLTPPRRGRPAQTHGNRSLVKFQLTPPRRGRRAARLRPGPGPCFNSRPREGGDVRLQDGWCDVVGFNSRPREGGDALDTSALLPLVFQLTPPRRGRPRYGVTRQSTFPFQLTPPRRGRPDLYCNDCSNRIVSTHAPAKGATQSAPR